MRIKNSGVICKIINVYVILFTQSIKSVMAQYGSLWDTTYNISQARFTATIRNVLGYIT